MAVAGPAGEEKQVSQLSSAWLNFFLSWAGLQESPTTQNQTKANHSHPLVLLPVTPHLLLLLSDNTWLCEAPLAYGGWLGEEGRGGHGI